LLSESGFIELGLFNWVNRAELTELGLLNWVY